MDRTRDSRHKTEEEESMNNLCWCGDRVEMHTSRTVRNPHRRFLKCQKWKTPNDCGYFAWYDQVPEELLKTINDPNEEISRFRRKYMLLVFVLICGLLYMLVGSREID